MAIGERFQQWDRQSPLEGLMEEESFIRSYMTTPCWNCTFDLNNPYPRINIGCERFQVGEFILGLMKGRPRWVVSSHLCDNKRCCRPSHLEIDTAGGNIKAKFDRGLQSHRGENHNQAKLTQNQVDEMRSRMVWNESDQRYYPAFREQFARLAEEFGVHPRSIYGIATGLTWPWN